MRNRRLVPVPPARRRRAPAEPPQPPPAVRQPLLPPRRCAVPPISWPPKNYDIAALLFTMAIAGAARPWRHVIFLICAIYFLIRGWLWLCRRHPLVAWFVFGFVEGLLGSGRRRRR